jgi:hypothetical protein
VITMHFLSSRDRKAVFGLVGLLLAGVVAGCGPGWSQQTDADQSLAAWGKIAQVLRHPRCLNCHQLDRPLQGDSRRAHIPPVFAASTTWVKARCAAATVTTGSGTMKWRGAELAACARLHAVGRVVDRRLVPDAQK